MGRTNVQQTVLDSLSAPTHGLTKASVHASEGESPRPSPTVGDGAESWENAWIDLGGES